MRKFAILATLLALALAACVPATGTVNPADLNNREWTLLNIQYPDGTVSTPEFGEYTLEFDFEEERMFVVADCNQGSAAFEANEDGLLVVGPIALTRVACAPGSISDEFVAQLGLANNFGFTDGYLHLSTLDSVNLVFQR